jgi:hypothetical protein
MITLTPQDKWLNVFDNENIHSAVVPSETHITFVTYFMADCNGRHHNSRKDFYCAVKYGRSVVLLNF